MSDGSDSDDWLLLKRGLTTNKNSASQADMSHDGDDLSRALEESKATFAVETARRKRHLLNHETSDDDVDEEEEEQLEVLGPSSTIKQEETNKQSAAAAGAASKRTADKRPRLSSSGFLPQDPVDLASDNSSGGSSSLGDLGMSLATRLSQHTQTVAFTAKPTSRNNSSRFHQDRDSMHSSDDDDDHYAIRPRSQLKPPPVASLPSKTTTLAASRTKPAVAAAAAKPSLTTTGAWALSSDSDGSFTATHAALMSSSRSDMADNKDTRSGHLRSLTSKAMPALSSSSDDDSLSDQDKPSQSSRKSVAIVPPKNKTNRTAAEKQREKEEKERQKQEQKEAKERQKLEKKAAKERGKMQRQLERDAKQAVAAAEKESKKRHRADAAQAAGKHAKDEIVVLMDPDLFRHDRLRLVDDLQEAGYENVLEYPSGIGGCKVLQFIRKDYCSGGAMGAIQMLYAGNEDYVHLPVMAVVFDDPLDFIRLLARPDHEEDDDYPALVTWLRGIETGWRAAWRVAAKQRPRTLLLLHQVPESLDKLWVKHRKSKNRDMQAPPTAEELHDAITWMLIEFQVECIHCSTIEDVSKDVKKLTRMLAEEPYQRQVTDLECVKKIKASCSDLAPPEERAADCWKRQLQQVPSVSDKVASSLVEYYPTARSLWIAYQNEDLTENEKRLLLAECCGTGRRHTKISDNIYRLMTSRDPKEIL